MNANRFDFLTTSSSRGRNNSLQKGIREFGNDRGRHSAIRGTRQIVMTEFNIRQRMMRESSTLPEGNVNLLERGVSYKIAGIVFHLPREKGEDTP